MCANLMFLIGILASDAQECGRAPIIDGRNGVEDRIVGGEAAEEGAWPWQVDIQVCLSLSLVPFGESLHLFAKPASA